MQHPDEGTIHSWLDGALSADEAARVEAHVKECPECAAVVAEARGFIAGASRILTALDNAPRGVIPAAAPKKRIDPWVLRVAATVLVVAAGTLVVVRNGGRDAETTTMGDSARIVSTAVAPMAQTADEAVRTPAGSPSPTRIQPNSSGSAAADGLQQRAGATETNLAKSAAVGAFSDTSLQFAAPAPGVTYSAAGAAASQANIPARDNKKVTGQVLGAVTEKGLEPPGYAGVDARAPQAFTPPTRLSGVIARGVASAQPPLKVVGTPRALGAKITLYEVAPGDTVTLTELMNLRLESVVTTGITSAEPLARQSTAKSAAARPTTTRADTAGIRASDSQRVSAKVAAPAPAPPAIAPVSQVEVANGVTTISWADGTTGNVLKLSGRMPEARLQEIKIRIERERAAAAAAATKRNP